MAGVDDSWSSNANDVLEISLVKPSPTGLRSIVAPFNPKFTYAIFGDDQRIFGYQELKISLRYHVSDMRPNLQVTYSKKFRSIGETEPTDIPAALHDFIPEVAFQRSSDFETAIKQVPSTWTPPGERIKEFDSPGGRYEVWSGSLSDPAVKQLVNRIQILVPLLIEAGTFIGTDDEDSLDRWTIFFLYHKKEALGSTGEPSYEFAGYSTVYRFFPFKSLTAGAAKPAVKADLELPSGKFPLSELPCRSRISQFIILPPFQGKGNAGRLYSTIFDHYLHNPQTVEITVEDPNEAFDDLRDLTDLEFLRTQPEFRSLRINSEVTIPKKGPSPKNIVDQKALEELRLRTKIAPRQFCRVVEMDLMSKLPDAVRPGIEEKTGARPSKEQEQVYKLWALLVKQRLYRHNKELLGQLERIERIEKLDETLSSVEFDYARLLAVFERRAKLKAADSGVHGKRKLGEEENGEPSSKKARVEDA